MFPASSRLGRIIGSYEYAYLYNMGERTLAEIQRWEDKAFNDASSFLGVTFGQQQEHIKLELATYDLRGKFDTKDISMDFTYRVHAGRGRMGEGLLGNASRVPNLFVVVDLRLDAVEVNFTNEEYRTIKNFTAARMMDEKIMKS